MKKKMFSNELAYFLGVILVSLGNAFLEHSDFGMGVVTLPAYLLHRGLSHILPWLTFGTALYLLEGVLLAVIVAALRKFKITWLFSFVTAVYAGLVLDGAMFLIGMLPADTIAWRILWFCIGLILPTSGIALLFHAYISPEVFELFVMELAAKLGKDTYKVKTAYDCCSFVVSLTLSFCFFGFGSFVGIGVGTAVCALTNGPMIGVFTKLYDRVFVFTDALPLRKLFEK